MRRPGLALPVLAAVVLAAPVLADEAETSHYLTLPSATKLKIDGFVQVYGSYFHDQDLYDNGSLLDGNVDPLDARSTPDRQFTMTARTSRFGISAITPSATLGDVRTRIEMDFAQERTFSGKPHLRQAYLTFGNWIIGHYSSNWSDPDAGAATVDFSGPIGQACNDTGNYTQVRYTFPLAPQSTLAFSVEKNITSHGEFPKNSHAGALKPGTTPDARYPTLVGAYTYTGSLGHLGLRALEQHYGAFTPAAGPASASRSNRWAGAVQLSGSLKLGQDSLVASWYTGQGLGPYGIGIQAAEYDPSGGVLFYRNSGWQAGYTHTWNARVRSNLVAGRVQFRDDCTGPASIKNANSYFVNSFVKLNPSVELGLEYGYENLCTFGQAVTRRDGSMSDRNHSNKVQASLTAKF